MNDAIETALDDLGTAADYVDEDGQNFDARMIRACVRTLREENRRMSKMVEWIPEEHDPIGRCVACHELVYPMYPENLNDDEPVMHKDCGL